MKTNCFDWFFTCKDVELVMWSPPDVTFLGWDADIKRGAAWDRFEIFWLHWLDKSVRILVCCISSRLSKRVARANRQTERWLFAYNLNNFIQDVTCNSRAQSSHVSHVLETLDRAILVLGFLARFTERKLKVSWWFHGVLQLACEGLSVQSKCKWNLYLEVKCVFM